MSAERYEISECELDVLAITGPEGTRYIDGEEIEARAIRQQARDIAALQQVISDQITVIEDLDHRRVKVCDENDQLRKELEKAAREPVAYCDGDNLDIGIPLRFPAFTLPQAFADTPLYAAPPAPVAEIRDVVVTDAVARKVFNAWIDARWRLNEGQDVKYGHAMIAVVRAELGPSLGLVEIREPTDDECRNIWREAKANEGDGSKVCAGRAMFDAVRDVMWPKSEGL